MKEKKPTTEEFWQEEQTYQTGSTNPPKSYGGIIAFLLVLVIFLCGISTALGLMNIHLFRQLSTMEQPQEDCAVAFSDAPRVESQTVDAAQIYFTPGFTGQSVPDFWQHYHDLPQGVYITQVDENSTAALCGLLPGDVLTHFDGIPVPNADTLLSLLPDYAPGLCLDIQVCREGSSITLRLTID